jgi:hypothetical protein
METNLGRTNRSFVARRRYLAEQTVARGILHAFYVFGSRQIIAFLVFGTHVSLGT